MQQQAGGPLAGRVHFLGTLDRETLATLYATVDVFVHPNAREPFGIAPLEAMASGVPVVVPDRGGVRTYASPRNAWLAAPTAEAFADAIEGALQRDCRRIERARSTAIEHSWRRATRRFFALYDEVTQQVPERATLAAS